MKNYTFWTFLAILFIFPLLGNAQMDGICGTTETELITKRLLRNKEKLKNGMVQFRNAVKYIPIKFHIVSESDGTGGVKLSRVLEQIQALNTDFEDSEFQFYIDGDFNYISNGTIYQSQSSFAAKNTMEAQRSDNAINIFLAKVANHGNSSNDNGVILGYHSVFRDWLVIRNDQVNLNSGTMSHELGHFFSLNHTHYGWDSKAWDHNDPSPIQVPATSPGNIPTEKQDGSNCQNAGDFICDTPPDYNFGFGWSKDGDRCANYDAGVKDPNGIEVDPMENNFMGYFIGCDEYVFTPGQIDVMTADYNSSARNYIRRSYVPNLNDISEVPVLSSPINDEITEGYNKVTLDWEGVPNADRYLVQIDRLPDFSFSPEEQVVFGTSAIFLDLDPDKFYYWRVFPFNEYETSAGFTQNERFRTGNDIVSASYIEGVKNWFISPNPLVNSNQLNLSLNTDEAFEADIKLFNLTGQQIQALPQQSFEIGQNNIQIQVGDLPKGIYVVTIQTADAILNKRLVIQ